MHISEILDLTFPYDNTGNMHAKASNCLDPNLINLHQHLHAFLSPIVPLLADYLHLSTTQTSAALHHAIDLSLLSQVLDAKTVMETQNNTHSQSYTKHNKRLYHTSLDTHTLAKLSVVSLTHMFGEQTAQVVQQLAAITKLSSEISQRLLALVATMVAARISHLGLVCGLNHNEKKYWLALQPVFFTPLQATASTDVANIRHWCDHLGWQLTIPNSHHHDYRQQLGRNHEMRFDQSCYAIPNHAWLIHFGHRLYLNHSQALSIGSTLYPKQRKTVTKPVSKTHIYGLIAIVLGLIGIGLFALLHAQKSTPHATISNPKSISTPSQDIAIVRIHDATEAQKKDDTPDSKSQPTPNDKKNSKHKEK